MNRSVIIALLLAVVVAGWILSGQIDRFTGDERPAAQANVAIGADEEASSADEAATEKPLTLVRVAELAAETRSIDVTVRGRTEALRSVDVKAEGAGRVVAVKVERGQRVKKGDILVRLAVEDHEARLAKARAGLAEMEIKLKAASSLSKKGFAAETTVAQAQAAYDSAKADIALWEVNLDHLTIRAPFDGFVEERSADIGDFLDVGNKVATVIDEDPFLVVGYVNETDVRALTQGTPGVARLVSGETAEGTVRFISKRAEETTRTFRVELEVANPERTLRSGVTATISFPVGEVKAHFVSPAVLTLNDDGVIGVRIVDDEDIVHFLPTRIISDTTKGVWITGLPDRVRVITVGQEFVGEGQKVKPVDAAELTQEPKGETS
ncbi:efflux RND transporter periplasmic adaptor subunit [Oceanibacterium hippocampi]|uniref:Multidrug resistance protein MdtN n=1 Tax=Oceanibacterium hippocampi TaxID=745714 RepID=A0A1Y5TZ03_9PROT|nr:efflux RND transporter periplasmic adaptor subunit [Oceanibacterium hippocampi]SLN76874.1 Multidrug resistance protein MdtN [Oceanibacterium hippocampi]